MGIEDFPIGCNREEPIRYVEHFSLERAGESPRKSTCIACNTGWLLMRRDPEKKFQLKEDDICHLCGQRYVYTDIERVRREIG